ncbi:hypothetical protein BAMA111019_15735 [Bacillus manliponensis]
MLIDVFVLLLFVGMMGYLFIVATGLGTKKRK